MVAVESWDQVQSENINCSHWHFECSSINVYWIFSLVNYLLLYLSVNKGAAIRKESLWTLRWLTQKFKQLFCVSEGRRKNTIRTLATRNIKCQSVFRVDVWEKETKGSRSAHLCFLYNDSVIKYLLSDNCGLSLTYFMNHLTFFTRVSLSITNFFPIWFCISQISRYISPSLVAMYNWMSVWLPQMGSPCGNGHWTKE